MKFLCDHCKAKYQIADEKVVGKTVRMKCRKCGHLIEVRSAVTESSVSVSVPAPMPSSKPPPPPKAPPKPPPPKKAPLAASLASTKHVPPKVDRPMGSSAGSALGVSLAGGSPSGGALAGAFRSTVQREPEEVSAPFDMSELSGGDEWYVAINGVPVGPIRISEVRRKAALGAVTEDSLAWQEGLDEWRPVRSFADLAAIVREAAASGRSSLTPPPPEARTSHPPHARAAMPMRAAPPAARTPAPRQIPLSGASTSAARSNVVPITSRLATAERLEEAHHDGSAAPLTAVVSDPFAPPAAAAIAPPGEAVPIVASASMAPPALLSARKKETPWMAIGMVVLFAAFGITTALALFLRPAASPPPSLAVQAPSAGTVPGPSSIPATAAAPTATDTAEPGSSAATPGGKGPVAMVPRAAPTPNGGAGNQGPAGRSLDLHSLTASTVAPSEDPGSDTPKAPGQCLGEGQVQQVIGLHQLAIRRSCWERNPTAKPTVNVSISMTVGPDGSAQSVVASGDEPSVTKCIENDVRGWRFPAMGCSQKTSFSFKFVRQ